MLQKTSYIVEFILKIFKYLYFDSYINFIGFGGRKKYEENNS